MKYIVEFESFNVGGFILKMLLTICTTVWLCKNPDFSFQDLSFWEKIPTAFFYFCEFYFVITMFGLVLRTGSISGGLIAMCIILIGFLLLLEFVESTLGKTASMVIEGIASILVITLPIRETVYCIRYFKES